MPITVTPASMPSGVPGTPYSQTLSASGGTAPYKFRLKSGSLPPGLSLASTGGNVAGCTINYSPNGTVSNIRNNMTRWSGLVYPIVSMKVFATPESFPTPTTLASAPNDVRAAVALGVPFWMCYKITFSGTYNDPAWPGGADKPTPSQIASDQQSMISSIQALQNVGATISGIVINQEGNSTKNANSADQYTYLYYKNYSALKAATGLPVICIFSAYKTGNSNIAAYFPGPTVLNPGATLYTDGIGADWYHEGYNNGCFMYSGTPSVPGYADLADYAHVKFGFTECGNSASGGSPSQAIVTSYLSSNPAIGGDPVNSLQAVLQYRMNGNLPCLPTMWYENDGGTGANIITSSTDYRIPILREIAANQAAFTSPLVSGTPTLGGVYPFTVAVTDNVGASATANLSITIGASALTIVTTGLPPAVTGRAYTTALAATGGTPWTT
jgi:hypothetical protein